MLNKLSAYSVVKVIPVIALGLAAIMYALEQPASPVLMTNDIQVTANTSETIAGDRIAMKHSVTGDVQVGGTLTLTLNFALSASQLLELEFVESEQYQFSDAPGAVYSADEQGRLMVQLLIRPVVAGKMYVKFLAGTTDGERIRSFSIPLRVKDSNGLMPSINSTSNSRVNLPVKAPH